MDRLALFGLVSVTAMLVCYALEDRSRWFVWRSRRHVQWARSMDSFRALGRSAWWRPSGLSSRYGDGGYGQISSSSRNKVNDSFQLTDYQSSGEQWVAE